MQTFMPEPSFALSARRLDYQRLGKQRVETKQLLLALGVPVGEHKPKGSSWANHPAAKMWRGHTGALARYGQIICEEWIARGYQDTLLEQFIAIADDSPAPPWMGLFRFHLSHQSNLIRKDPAHYSPFWPGVGPELEYVWPVDYV